MTRGGGPGRRLGEAMLLAVAQVLCASPAASQQLAAGAHATRQGQAVQGLEETLLRAMRQKDRAPLERLLGDEFEMTVAQEPGNPVDRDRWIGSVMAAPDAGWLLDQVVVRDHGEWATASFLLRPQAGATRVPVFVVDTWRRDGAQWQLQARYAALALGPRSAIPGNAATRDAPKKY